jgi:hypothetical protein
MKTNIPLTRLNKLNEVDNSETTPYFKYYLGQCEFADLLPVQQKRFERLRTIWSLAVSGSNTTAIKRHIHKHYGIEDRQIAHDIKLAFQLHGELSRVDKDGRRAASIEYFDKLSKAAFKAEDFAAAAKAREAADKLAGLHTTEELGFTPEDFVKPTKRTYVIKSAQPIDIDYEDVA